MELVVSTYKAPKYYHAGDIHSKESLSGNSKLSLEFDNDCISSSWKLLEKVPTSVSIMALKVSISEG